MRRSRASGCGSLLLAALVFVGSLAWLVYSFRSVEVACRRDDGPIHCSAVERVGGFEVWSAEVDDIRIVRSMARRNGGPSGVIAETEAGALLPLTSNVLGEDQMDAIGNRIHQWIFVERESETLEFTQAPSLANAALAGGIAVLAVLWGLGAAVGVARRLARPRSPARRVSI